MISGNNAGHFNLDQYSGVLTVVGALDYEGTQSYSLVVHAIDGGASPRTAITTVTVSVNDLNDNAPSCSTALFAVSLQENSAASTAVVAGSAMGCTDADDSPNGDVTCSLDSTSNVNSAFGVGSSSCDVTVNSQSALDIETTPSWSLLVLVSDSATVPADRLTATVTIVVTLTDVNEAGPSFTPGTMTATRRMATRSHDASSDVTGGHLLCRNDNHRGQQCSQSWHQDYFRVSMTYTY